MELMCFQLMTVQISVLVVTCMDSRYIGCYENLDDFTSENFTHNNSGDACVRHCYPKYRYAGAYLSVCSCGSELKGNKVDDTECDEKCLDPLFNGTCGSEKDGILSVYTTGDKDKVKYSNQSHEEPPSTTENADLYIAMAIIIVVVLVTVIFGLTVIIRRRFARSFEIAQTFDKSFYNNKANTADTINPEENGNINDNGDIYSIHSSSSIQGEYNRLRMPDGFCPIDQNYSRINQKKQGACVILDDGYSHLKIPAGTDVQFSKSCTCCSKSKQLSKSGKFRKGHRFGQQQRDDSYDKTGSHILCTSAKQKNAFSRHARHNFIITGSRCRCDKCVDSNSKNKHTQQLVNVSVEVKRPHTYDEIDFDEN